MTSYLRSPQSAENGSGRGHSYPTMLFSDGVFNLPEKDEKLRRGHDLYVIRGHNSGSECGINEDFETNLCGAKLVRQPSYLRGWVGTVGGNLRGVPGVV